jgi:hypothetical protein
VVIENRPCRARCIAAHAGIRCKRYCSPTREITRRESAVSR